MTDTASASLPALGICLEDYEYPYPVRFLQLTNDLQPVAMAYMDIPPTAVPNGQTMVLFHGKAFGCYYFQNVIEALTGAGYRRDDRRPVHLVLEDPLGLVDYRTGIPPQSEETLYDHEIHWTDPAVIRGYVKGYFAHPDPKIWEPLADVLVRVALSPDYQRWARAAALAFQMIYQQPVRYEYPRIAAPVADIPHATRVVVPDCGHIPHLEQPGQFLAELLPFLAR
jgi:hypothetical protein